MKEPSYSLALIFSNPIGEMVEKNLEMRDHQIWRLPGEICLMEGDGPISFLQLMSCEYHLLRPI